MWSWQAEGRKMTLDEQTAVPQKKKPNLRIEPLKADEKGVIGIHEVEEKKNIQISMKLDEQHSAMLAEVKEWCQKQRLWGIYGERFLPSDAETDTTLSRTLLYAALESMQREMELDKLVLLAVELWDLESKFDNEPDIESVKALWAQNDYRELADDMLTYVVKEAEEKFAEVLYEREKDKQREKYNITDDEIREHLLWRERRLPISPVDLRRLTGK
ncbi:hypothetical protein MITS9508_01124 [Synechococcus sp. MIT S9508]|nr:hypothetical protein MITS9508_01124 [Synechococcus sp. MIT S9508]